MIEENIRSSLLPDHGRVALLLLDVDRIPFSHSGRVERNGGTSVGNRYLLSGMGEIAGAVERKIKKWEAGPGTYQRENSDRPRDEARARFARRSVGSASFPGRNEGRGGGEKG